MVKLVLLHVVLLKDTETIFFFFFKSHFIGYAITVVPISPLASLPPAPPPTPSGSPHTAVHVHGSCTYVLWPHYSLCCTILLHGYSVTTDLYLLIPSPFSPILLSPHPFGNHQNILCIYDSVSVLLACLFFKVQLLINMYSLPFYCSYF